MVTSSAADTPARRLEIYKRLAERHGILWFFTTLGSRGMEGYNGREFLLAASPEIRVVNAIGSGDAASAGIGWTLLKFAGASASPRPSAKGKGLQGAGAGRDALGSIQAAFDSPECFKGALLNGAAMGTANCLNLKNGRVEPADFSAVLKKTVIREALDS